MSMLRDDRQRSLYEPAFEHDACGVGFVADLNNVTSHDVVRMGLEVLANLDHRGARGAEPDSGDGAGVLVQLPHAFFLREWSELGLALPKPGHYAVGQCFLPRDARTHRGVRRAFERALDELELEVLGWREVPTDNTGLGAAALSGEPAIAQVAVRRPVTCRTQDDFERRLFVARKYADPPGARVGPRRRALLRLLDVLADDRLQGHAHAGPGADLLPGPRRRRASSRPWPSSTAASRPTRCRPGRWPTPSGPWPTTARSTRCAATSTG